jgi:hypothetical protein
LTHVGQQTAGYIKEEKEERLSKEPTGHGKKKKALVLYIIRVVSYNLRRLILTFTKSNTNSYLFYYKSSDIPLRHHDIKQSQFMALKKFPRFFFS